MFTIEVYPSRRGLLRRKQWSWRVVANNGQKVIPPESYNNRQDLLDEIDEIKVGLRLAPIMFVDR